MATHKSNTNIHSKQEGDAGLLSKVARTIGSALGAVANKTGLDSGPARNPEPRMVRGKFQKSGKHRLPRKLKKLMRKQAATGQGEGASASPAMASAHSE